MLKILFENKMDELYDLYIPKTGLKGRIVGDQYQHTLVYIPDDPTENEIMLNNIWEIYDEGIDPCAFNFMSDGTDIGIFSSLITYCISLLLENINKREFYNKNYYLYHVKYDLTMLFPSSKHIKDAIPLLDLFNSIDDISIFLEFFTSIDYILKDSVSSSTEFIICGFNLYEFVEKIICIDRNVSNILEDYCISTMSPRECARANTILSLCEKELVDIIIQLCIKYKQLFCNDRMNYLSFAEGIEYDPGSNHILKYLTEQFILREICLYFHCDNKYWKSSEINQLLSLISSI